MDPNKHRFRLVVRIIAYVIKFVRALQRRTKKKSSNFNLSNDLQLSDSDIKESERYFFKKATDEVKQFNQQKSYSRFTKEIDNILMYTGRILPSDEVTVTGRFTNAMLDLSSKTFCVPVVDKHSPIAYSLVNDIHWFDDEVKHTGVETVWRRVLSVAFIIEGRGIV